MAIRTSWKKYRPRIAKLSAAGLGPAGILSRLGLEISPSNQTQVQKIRRQLGFGRMAPLPTTGANPNRRSPSAVWDDYQITSDWRDPACVERDMGGRRFEDVTFRGASRDPIFMPARKRAHSAGVAEYGI